jgi:hypothetical protein
LENSQEVEGTNPRRHSYLEKFLRGGGEHKKGKPTLRKYSKRPRGTNSHRNPYLENSQGGGEDGPILTSILRKISKR